MNSRRQLTSGIRETGCGREENFGQTAVGAGGECGSDTLRVRCVRGVRGVCVCGGVRVPRGMTAWMRGGEYDSDGDG